MDVQKPRRFFAGQRGFEDNRLETHRASKRHVVAVIPFKLVAFCLDDGGCFDQKVDRNFPFAQQLFQLVKFFDQDAVLKVFSFTLATLRVFHN
jgi:hypothetical protein